MVLYDLTGRKVLELNDVQSEQLIEPGAHLTASMYLLQVDQGEALRHYRLLKIK